MERLIEWILKIIRYILKNFNSLIFQKQQPTKMPTTESEGEENEEKKTKNINFEFTELEYISNQYSNQNNNINDHNKKQLNMIPVSDELKSRWESMRLKKHFTFQTNVLLKPNQPVNLF